MADADAPKITRSKATQQGDENRKTVEDLRAQVKKLEDEKKDMQKKINQEKRQSKADNNNDGNNAALEAQLETLQGQHDGIVAQRDALQGELTLLQAKNVELTKKVTDLEAAKTNLEGQVTDLGNEIQTAKEDKDRLEANIQVITNERDEYKASLDTKTKEKANLLVEHGKVETSRNILLADKATLQGERSLLSKKIALLEKTIQEKGKPGTSSESVVTAAENGATQVMSDAQSLTADNAHLRDEVNKMSQLIIDNEQTIRELLATIANTTPPILDSSNGSDANVKPKALMISPKEHISVIHKNIPKSTQIEWSVYNDIDDIKSLTSAAANNDQLKKFKKYDILIVMLGYEELKSGQHATKVYSGLIRAVTKLGEATGLPVALPQLHRMSSKSGQVLIINNMIENCTITGVHTLNIDNSLSNVPYSVSMQQNGCVLTDAGAAHYAAALSDSVSKVDRSVTLSSTDKNNNGAANAPQSSDSEPDSQSSSSSDGDSDSDGEIIREATLFPEKYAGEIVGKDAKNARRIRQETGATVYCTPWQEVKTERYGAVLLGTRRNIQAAKDAIQTQVNNAMRRDREAEDEKAKKDSKKSKDSKDSKSHSKKRKSKSSQSKSKPKKSKK